jgi:hypothetical protein
LPKADWPKAVDAGVAGEPNADFAGCPKGEDVDDWPNAKPDWPNAGVVDAEPNVGLLASVVDDAADPKAVWPNADGVDD